jgi:hypothetical protein
MADAPTSSAGCERLCLHHLLHHHCSHLRMVLLPSTLPEVAGGCGVHVRVRGDGNVPVAHLVLQEVGRSVVLVVGVQRRPPVGLEAEVPVEAALDAGRESDEGGRDREEEAEAVARDAELARCKARGEGERGRRMTGAMRGNRVRGGVAAYCREGFARTRDCLVSLARSPDIVRSSTTHPQRSPSRRRPPRRGPLPSSPGCSC